MEDEERRVEEWVRYELTRDVVVAGTDTGSHGSRVYCIYNVHGSGSHTHTQSSVISIIIIIILFI